MSLLSPPRSTRRRLSTGISADRAAGPLESLWPQISWQVAPGEAPCAARFIDPIEWSRVCRDGSLTVVKTGPHRTVYQLDTTAGRFFLKHFHPTGIRNWLKHLFRPTRAEHERDIAFELTCRGIKTFRPVAVGVVRRHGSVCESLLLSHAVADSVALDEFCDSSEAENRERSMLRQQLARAAGAFIGQLHSRGGNHRDLHAGNLLVRLKADGPFEPPSFDLTWIDLQAVQLGSRVPEGTRRRGLVALHQFFVGRTTRTDRLRFWRAYNQATSRKNAPAVEPTALDLLARSLGWPPTASAGDDRLLDRARQQRLERHLAEGARQGWLRADRALARGNRHVKKIREQTNSLRGLATLPTEWLRQIARSPEQLFAADHIERFCKQSARCRVALAKIPCPTGMISACVKSVVSKRWVARLLGWGRWSLVRRSWETGHALLRRGIATPRPLFCVETHSPAGIRGYLATEWIADTETAQQFAGRIASANSFAAVRPGLESRVRRLARQLRRLHDCAFDHRDLKLANLLVSTYDHDSRVWLLDLDGVRRWKRLPRQRIVQNLARLDVSSRVQGIASKTVRLRFLKWYLAESRADWRIWWRLVERSGKRKESQNARRGRPIS